MRSADHFALRKSMAGLRASDPHKKSPSANARTFIEGSS
jgi:hypothetical protein